MKKTISETYLCWACRGKCMLTLIFEEPTSCVCGLNIPPKWNTVKFKNNKADKEHLKKLLKDK